MPIVSLNLTGGKSYDIHVENGAIDKCGELACRTGFQGKIAVISDSVVYPIYGGRVIKAFQDAGYIVSSHVVPSGEASKSLSQTEMLCSELVLSGHDRTSCIVALGGGVIGDLAGFVSSIYYRGISFIQIPTTVLAQTDSSVGGKTAVNISEGKNLIGAFHQPSLVIADPLTLVSLPTRILAEGFAEAIKHAVIRDMDMLEDLKAVAPNMSIGFSLDMIGKLPDLIARNIAIKARIVEEDEKEILDVRALLNFGHTIGHGIEASRPYGEILHGEAVALGMRAALFLSSKLMGLPKGYSERVIGILKEMGLPVLLPDEVIPDLVFSKMLTDKKFKNGVMRFVLLDRNSKPVVSDNVSEEDVKQAIEELRVPC